MLSILLGTQEELNGCYCYSCHHHYSYISITGYLFMRNKSIQREWVNVLPFSEEHRRRNKDSIAGTLKLSALLLSVSPTPGNH